ncbi:THAP domain-containing protein 5-like [Diprion similis]|uniref:THAP domain-containing protein 5-like n=1 Tax=Diprion similis TaxID=362088 RepID=UPI001EF83F45|nr:THAP domain-containing protein 5-like [Diprion similis]
MGFCCFCKKIEKIHSSLHFFKFPKQNYKEWMKNMGREDWIPKKHDTLCSDHFTIDSFDYGEYRVRLRKGALPTIFGLLDNGKNRHKEAVISPQQITKCRDINLGFESDTRTLMPMVYTETSESPSCAFSGSDCEQSIDVNDTEDSYGKDKILPTSLIEVVTLHTASAIQATQSRTCRSRSVEHDHHYVDTPETLRKKLNAARLRISKFQSERKCMVQQVKRLKVAIKSMKSVIEALQGKKMASETGLYSLSVWESKQLKCSLV